MRSYNRLDVDRLHETATEKSLRDEIERSAKRARNRTSDRALPRFTAEHEGRRRIVEEPPLITRVIRPRSRAPRRGAGRVPATRWPRTGDGCSAATRWSTSPTRWSGSAASVCGPTSRCSRAAAPTTWCSCSSSRRAGRCWPVRARRLGLARASGPAGGGVPAGAADRQRPAAGLDHRRRAAVLRPAVPEHEGHHPAGRDRRRRPGRLRRHRRPPAGQGPRPDQRRLDDRRLRRVLATSSTGRWPRSPARTPTRPRPTTRGWSRRSAPAGCRCSTERWTASVQPSDPADRRRRRPDDHQGSTGADQPEIPPPHGASQGSPPVRLRPDGRRLARAEVGRDRSGPASAAGIGLEHIPRRPRPVGEDDVGAGPGQLQDRRPAPDGP